MLAWAPANPAGAQEPPIADEVQIAPCDGRCPYTLAVEVVAEVGHDAGPGMVDGLSNAVMDSSGRVYVVGREGRLLHEVRMSELMQGAYLIPWGGTLAVHETNIRTPERIGYPLHLVDLATGEIEASFGSLTGEYDWERERVHDVVPVRGPVGTVWMARNHAYWIELWSPDNQLHLSMRRDLEWFPDALDDLDGHPLPTDPPEPRLVGLSADDSLMWVMIFRASDNWEEVDPRDFLERYDTHVEVIDWRRGQVIASRRFNEPFLGLTGPGGLSGKIVTTEGASVRNRVVRIKLSSW